MTTPSSPAPNPRRPTNARRGARERRHVIALAVLAGALALSACGAPGDGGGPATGAAGLFPFFADDGVHGSEPWVTDGTPEGTRLLADLVPGPGSSEDFGSLRRYARLGSELVFYASDAANTQTTLYRSDGTTAGTVAIVPGMALPLATARFGDREVFNHVEASGPPQGLYRTDGTLTGTVRLGDVVPGLFTGVRVPRPPLHLVGSAGDGSLFANYQGELVRIDEGGATVIRAFDEPCSFSSGTFTPGIGTLGTRLFFNASAPFTHPTTGASEAARCELWRYDDAGAEGPVIHRAFAANATQSASVRGFADADGWLYYTVSVADAAGATVTSQARATDGTSAPTDGSIDDGDVNLGLDITNGALAFLQRAADEPIYVYARTPDTGGVTALARLVGGPHAAALELIQPLPDPGTTLTDVYGWVGDTLIYRVRGTDAGLYALRNGSNEPVLLFDAAEVPSERFSRDRVYPRAFFWVRAPWGGADPATAPLVETLWVTDGTPAGTRALRSFCTADGSCPPAAD